MIERCGMHLFRDVAKQLEMSDEEFADKYGDKLVIVFEQWLFHGLSIPEWLEKKFISWL